MTKKDERIQQLAYQIWESEGRPGDQHDRHWEMATRLYEAEGEGVAPKAVAKKPRTSKSKTGSEKGDVEAVAAGESTTEKVESKVKKAVDKTKQAAKSVASKAKPNDENGAAKPAAPKKPRAPRASKPAAAKPIAGE